MIKHPKRGTISEFNFSIGMGLAGAFLSPKEEGEEAENHRIHFFDKELKSADWDEGAPPYAFIAGLGFADYYTTAKTPAAVKLSLGTPCGNLPTVELFCTRRELNDSCTEQFVPLSAAGTVKLAIAVVATMSAYHDGHRQSP